MAFNRTLVDEKIAVLIDDKNVEQTKTSFATEISLWLDSVEADDLTKTQILADLESYGGYHALKV